MNYEDQNFTDSEMLRARAEELLRTNQKTKNDPLTEFDEKRLLHELQVHQIELEMQNAELMMANETAESALKKYTMLYDFAPMGYFTLDEDGTISDLNFTAAEMLGDKRIALVESNFKLFISEASRSVFNTFFSKVFDGRGKESCEVNLGYDEHPLGRVYMEGILHGDEPRCLLSVVSLSFLE